MKRRGFLQALCASILAPAGSVLAVVMPQTPFPTETAIPTRKPYIDGPIVLTSNGPDLPPSWKPVKPEPIESNIVWYNTTDNKYYYYSLDGGEWLPVV
jgi:hypothetical protein